MNKIPPDLKKIVLWTLETEVPQNFKLSIGNKGAFSKEELKRHIEKEDDIGREYAEMRLRFIKSLMSGEISRQLAE